MNHVRPLREHVLLSLTFVLSRGAIQWTGIRFNFSLDWMWLADPADLRDRLLETLYYFHAFPPGMNLVTGILLKLGGANASTLALIMFWAMGLILVNSLFYLSRVVGLPAPMALGVAIAFSLLPQSIYFEHLYIYEYPIAALLCLAAVFFYRAVSGRSFWAWVAFFVVCSAIGMTRSTFHLVWFLAMVGLGVLSAERRARRMIFGAACVPAAVLLALYVKNFALFGAFDSFTSGPLNYSLVTIWHLPVEVRESLIQQGALSPFAAVSVYAGPREYLPLCGTNERDGWPPQLTRMDRPSVNAANYNHWCMLEVNRGRRADAWYYVRTYPLDYGAHVLHGLKDMFTPSTEWHPQGDTDASPHYQHRQAFGRYEGVYNRIVHGVLFAPVGVYAFVPLAMAWTFRRARSLTRTGDANATARASLLYWCLFQISFVVAVSSVFTFRESARYRYQIESMIWLMAVFCLVSLWRSLVGRFHRERGMKF
jgi:hypothetical protein